MAENEYPFQVNECIYPTPFQRTGCDTRVIFQWSSEGLKFLEN